MASAYALSQKTGRRMHVENMNIYTNIIGKHVTSFFNDSYVNDTDVLESFISQDDMSGTDKFFKKLSKTVRDYCPPGLRNRQNTFPLQT